MTPGPPVVLDGRRRGFATRTVPRACTVMRSFVPFRLPTVKALLGARGVVRVVVMTAGAATVVVVVIVVVAAGDGLSPAPVSTTVCGPSDALSPTRRVACRFP